MSERDFQGAVIDLARILGWKVAHFRTALNARGKHMTPVAADGKGWPDLVLAHPDGRFMVRELKSAKGRLSDEQTMWINLLCMCGVDAGIWRPAAWDRVQSELAA